MYPGRKFKYYAEDNEEPSKNFKLGSTWFDLCVGKIFLEAVWRMDYEGGHWQNRSQLESYCTISHMKSWGYKSRQQPGEWLESHKYENISRGRIHRAWLLIESVWRGYMWDEVRWFSALGTWLGVGTIKERQIRNKRKRQICRENQGLGYVEVKLLGVLWTELCPGPQFMCWSSNPQCMVFRDRSFER